MKRYILIVLCIYLPYLGLAQDTKTYTVDGSSYELKTEVSGTVDLLWNIIDKEYRYFVKKDATVIELVNTKEDSKTYQEQYKKTLKDLTSDVELSVDKLKFTLPSLRDFINDYNKARNPDYVIEKKAFKLQTRLGILGGMTNVPFVENPDNEILSMFFGELEFYDDVTLRKHSFYMRVKHIPQKEQFKYETTQLGLGYRFKFIKTEVFNLYSNVTFATLNFSKSSLTFIDDDMERVTNDRSATNFDVPFIFGIGLDVRLTNNLYATFDYDELFSVFFDNQDNFSKHLAFGVKFNL